MGFFAALEGGGRNPPPLSYRDAFQRPRIVGLKKNIFFNFEDIENWILCTFLKTLSKISWTPSKKSWTPVQEILDPPSKKTWTGSKKSWTPCPRKLGRGPRNLGPRPRYLGLYKNHILFKNLSLSFLFHS